MSVKEKMNGLRIPWPLVGVLILLVTGWGTLQAQVQNNVQDIERFQKVPVQVATIERDVKNLDKNFAEFKQETKDGFAKIDVKFDKMGDKMDKILIAITQ